MKKIPLVLFVSCLFVSCNDNDESNERSACGVENPTLDLAWLKSEIGQREQDEEVDYQYSYIMQTTFENNDIFIYGDCNPLANSVFSVYNCSGENIGYIGDEKFSTDLRSKGTVIWKTADNKCNFSAF